MVDFGERLRHCFSVVFPAMSPSDIPNASVRTVSEWDSMMNINLLCVIEEEFEIEISATDLEGLTSFGAILNYLESQDDLGT